MDIPVKKVGLSVVGEASHKFTGYGMYIGGCGEVDEETRRRLEKMIFVDLGARIVHQCFEMNYAPWEAGRKNFKEGEDHLDPYNLDEIDAWIEMRMKKVGYGGKAFTEDMKKHGAVYAFNMCGLLDHHLSEKTVEQRYTGATEETLELIRGTGAESAIVSEGVHPIDDDYIPTYVDLIVNFIKRMIQRFDLPVKYVSAFDEPNFGAITPDQMGRIVRLMRQKFDENGLQEVLINGPASAGINLAYTEAIRAVDPEAFDIYQNITVHGFGTGMMDKVYSEKAKALGKELWLTSTGAPSGYKFSDLPRDEKGCLKDTDVHGVANASAVLIDVNLGASYMGNWACLYALDRLSWPVQYFMFLVDKGEGCPLLGQKLMATRYFDYVSTILTAVSGGAEIYYCESSEEGCMTERLNLTNPLNNQMASLVGKNADGKWGISILNKTDTETRQKEMARLYENMKPHNLPGHSVKLAVEVDIKALYGTGEKTFNVLKTGKNGMYMAPGGTVTLVDGKGTVYVDPFELVSLREI